MNIMLRFLPLYSSLCAILLFASASGAEDGPKVIVADQLTPADLGIDKYIFEGTAPEGSLLVFQCEESLDGRLVHRLQNITDTVSLAEPHREKVLLFNPGSPGVPRGYLLKALGGGPLPPPAFLRRMGMLEEGLTLVFEDDPDAKTGYHRFVYSMFVESAESVRARLLDLPPKKAHGWTFSTGYLPPEEGKKK